MNQPHARYDIYAFIHKGLRATMAQCLITLGNLDTQDDAELQPALRAVETLLNVCRAHVEHENAFVHTAMERRRPGSTRTVANEHVTHLAEITALEQEAQRIQRLPSLRRAEPMLQFYRDFALFMAENVVHMAKEESEHNAVLWDCYSDEEIQNIEHELVAHVAPDIMPVIVAYMVPAMNPAERTVFLGAMRASMPSDVFAGIIENIAPLLSPQHRTKLHAALQAQGALQKTA